MKNIFLIVIVMLLISSCSNQKLKDCRDEVNSLEYRIDELESVLQKKNNRINQLENTINQLEYELQEKNDRIDELENELQDCQDRLYNYE